jgi:hypothetical protein
MATLKIKNLGSLVFEPLGLMHDSFNGWTMRSSVSVSLGSRTFGMGQFMSGPNMQVEIERFVADGLPNLAYAPEFDGDLPSTTMALSLTRKEGGIQITIGREYDCAQTDHSNWMHELNDRSLMCSCLGGHHTTHTELVMDLIQINSWFEAIVAENEAFAFLKVLVSEIDAKRNR